MDKKVEPIYVEQIDNSDGSYIKKYVYAEFPEKDVEYLSKIETHNSDGIYQKCEYYSDNNFNNLYWIENRIYNSDGSYVNKNILSSPEKINWLKENLPFNFMRIPNTWLSSIENYDSNGVLLKASCFVNNNFSNLLFTILPKEKNGNCHIQKFILSSFFKNLFLSLCIKYNNDNKLIEESFYHDNNFTDLRIKITYEYDNVDYCTIKTILSSSSEYDYLSKIEKFDSNNKLIETDLYKDNNFKILSCKQKRKYNSDGSYMDKSIYIIPENGWLSSIENYSSDDLYLSANYYTDNNFSDLNLNVIWEYNTDKTYIKKFINKIPDKNNCLSGIEKYSLNHILLEASNYTDNNFTNLFNQVYLEHNSDGSCVKKFIWTDSEKNDYLSSIEKFDSNNKIVEADLYKDNNFKILSCKQKRKYNSDGSYMDKSIYTTPKNGWLSSIENYNSDNELIEIIYFTDENFSNIGCQMQNYPDGSSLIKVTRNIPDEDGYMFRILKYDSDNKLLENSAYTDNNFTNLHGQLHIEYRKDGTHIKKFKTVLPNKIGCKSTIAQFDSNDNVLKSINYISENFKNIYRKNYFKYLKDKSSIRLSEYEKPQNKILSEIAKINRDEEILYTRQYKFKGLLAKILFWLAK